MSSPAARRLSGGGGGSRTPGQPATDTRDRILEAARAELAETGALSVRGVAARAGVSRQTVHSRLGGLAGLRAALTAEGLDAGPPETDTRARILEAAVRALSRPAGAVGVDEIAAEAGLTKGAIYHHFGDRASLLRAVADRVSPVDEMLAALRTMESMSDQEALAELLRAYHAAITSRAELLHNLVLAGADDPELVRIVVREMLVRAAPVLLDWYRDRAARGGFRDVPPPLVFQAIFGPAWAQVVFGPFIDEILAIVGGRPVAEVAGDYADLLLRGLLPRSVASPSDAP